MSANSYLAGVILFSPLGVAVTANEHRGVVSPSPFPLLLFLAT